MTDVHNCPCGCGTAVPNNRLTCRPGWARIPGPLQRKVYATQHLSPVDPRRADVLADVMAVFAGNPGVPREWTPPPARHAPGTETRGAP